MKTILDEKLEFIREFQAKYPSSHVGGSIGLMMHGVDLKRDLKLSDVDITIDEFDVSNITIQMDERSDGNDFDLAYSFKHDSNNYTKIDIRINPEPSFDIISFNGYLYNVSKKRDILFWKQKYAHKGVYKHIQDMIVINGGEREIQKYEYDLPF